MDFSKVADTFNKKVKLEYLRGYEGYSPELKNKLMYEYQSGPRKTNEFVFAGFLDSMLEWTGSRIHNQFPEGFTFSVTNKKWDRSWDLAVEDLERATTMDEAINLYKDRIAQWGKIVKDHPVQLAMNMLENGTTSTFGTTFDGQTLFSATHNYGLTAGTQSNIVAGSGVTLANVYDDLFSVMSRFDGFFDPLQSDTYIRKLNRTPNARVFVIAPTQLGGVFAQLKRGQLINGGNSNAAIDFFDYMTMQFADTNDWYVILQALPSDVDSNIRPFLFQVEKFAELDTPKENDHRLRENDVLTYGARGRYNTAYGAWWKIVKVTNV